MADTAGTMKLVRKLKFDVDMNHYDLREGAVIVYCIDNRFYNIEHSMLDAFIWARGWKHYDLLTKAGGIQVLASADPMDAAAREVLLDDILLALKLHKGDRLVLFVHSDCGKYGYLAAFGDDLGEEEKRLVADLSRAADAVEAFLEGKLPGKTNIECWVAAAGGAYELERQIAAAA